MTFPLFAISASSPVGGARTYARVTELLETMKEYEDVITLRKFCVIFNKN